MRTFWKNPHLLALLVVIAMSQVGLNHASAYSFFGSQWLPGPNTAANGIGLGPGGATWSAVGGGVSMDPGVGHSHSVVSTDIETLITGAVDGLEYSIIEASFNKWSEVAMIENLGQVTDSGAAIGASEANGGHLGDIRIAAFSDMGGTYGVAASAGTEAEGYFGTFNGDVHLNANLPWTDNLTSGVDFMSLVMHEL